MEPSIKPIKRSSQLAPLSREHHGALLFTWKIKQGLFLKISFDRMVNYCNWFFENHLKQHFKKEEETLVHILPVENPLIQKMIEEHKLIKTLLTDLSASPKTETLEGLADLVKTHVRFEERILFQQIEEVATDEELQQLTSELAEEENTSQWHDEFWISSTG